MLLKFIRSPQLVVVATLQGAMFLLIFRYVFGGAFDGSGAYVDYVVPGLMCCAPDSAQAPPRSRWRPT